MADYPALDLIEFNDAMDVTIMLGREAGLSDQGDPDGDPWSPTCRHHGPRHRRMRQKRSRMSYGVVAMWCEGCDRTGSEVYVPEGWL